MPILDDKTLDFSSNSDEQTVRLGVRLGELLEAGDVVCLAGELGTGKTTLARGIGRGWGAARRVTSPTFTLIHEYPRARDGRRLYHVDCYRLTRAAEVETLALDDLLDQGGAMMIEWPEIIQAYLPADRLWMAMRHLNETRRGLRLTASGPRSTELLKAFRFRAFGIRD